MILPAYADGRGGGRTARTARGTIKDGRAWVRTAGGGKDGRYLQRRRGTCSQNEGDYRGRPGMGNDGRG